VSFQEAFIYLFAAVISVPLAKRLGLGSVLGYLLAGIAIGPFCLRFVGTGGHDVMHFAEFGVVMMLFLIGLELRPALLWEMRGPILGLGSAQVVGTAVAVAAIGCVLRVPWQIAIAVGLIAAMSSTAIVLQSLKERGELKTPGGQACFSVLLFQDIAVIPILALLPLLAIAPAAADLSGSALSNFAAWQRAVVVLAAVAAVVLAGRFLLRPIFRYIAATRLREMFTATALLLVVGIALLMQAVGMSAALGTFLAGVVLADSEYRHQLETDIEPFKGLLLGLFFIAVGASIDFGLLGRQPATVALLVAGIVAVKFAVLLALGRLFRMERQQALLLAFALAQGGEFAFVLFSLAQTSGVIPAELVKLLVAVVALSMALAPLLFTAHAKLVQRPARAKSDERAPDTIDEHDAPVILAGFGRFGHIVGRVLRANGFAVTVLDHDPDQVETLRKFGLQSFYGDATRLDLLRTAGAETAQLFIIAIDEETKALELVATVQEHFPKLRIFARANSRQHASELIKAGVRDVYREMFGSAMDLSVGALLALGKDRGSALRVAEIFREHDEKSVQEMALIEGDEQAYISRGRQHIENLERALQSDRSSPVPQQRS